MSKKTTQLPIKDAPLDGNDHLIFVDTNDATDSPEGSDKRVSAIRLALTDGAPAQIVGGGSINLGGFTLAVAKDGTVLIGSGAASKIAQWNAGGDEVETSTLAKTGDGELTLNADHIDDPVLLIINGVGGTLDLGGKTLTIDENIVFTGGGEIVLDNFTLTVTKDGTVVVGTGAASKIAQWNADNDEIEASTLAKTGDGELTLQADHIDDPVLLIINGVGGTLALGGNVLTIDEDASILGGGAISLDGYSLALEDDVTLPGPSSQVPFLIPLSVPLTHDRSGTATNASVWENTNDSTYDSLFTSIPILSSLIPEGWTVKFLASLRASSGDTAYARIWNVTSGAEMTGSEVSTTSSGSYAIVQSGDLSSNFSSDILIGLQLRGSDSGADPKISYAGLLVEPPTL